MYSSIQINILVNREETFHQHSVGKNETSDQVFDFHETNFNLAIRLSRKDIAGTDIDMDKYIQFRAYSFEWYFNGKEMEL